MGWTKETKFSGLNYSFILNHFPRRKAVGKIETSKRKFFPDVKGVTIFYFLRAVSSFEEGRGYECEESITGWKVSGDTFPLTIYSFSRNSRKKVKSKSLGTISAVLCKNLSSLLL